MRTRVALGSKPRSETAAAPTAVLEPFSLFETGITFEVTIGRLSRNCSVLRSPDFCRSSWVKVSTGFGPTSSAVVMFEPVTMTRSAVAVAAAGGGKIFPCASRAGEGDGTCADRLTTMAKKIASRIETLRSNPHPRSWIFFIQVRLCREEYENARQLSMLFCSIFFWAYFLFFRPLSIIATTQGYGIALSDCQPARSPNYGSDLCTDRTVRA